MSHTPVSRRSVTTGLAWAAPPSPSPPPPLRRGQRLGLLPAHVEHHRRHRAQHADHRLGQPHRRPGEHHRERQRLRPVHFADGNYGKATFQTGTGSVYLGTWADLNTSTAQRNTGGQTITIQYPAGATGPVSFTIGDITAAAGTTTDSYGASTYTDAVQVTNNGAVVAPTSVTGATSSGGWVSGTSTTAGTPTYTINSPGTIVITLRKTATTVNGAHPNKTVSVSNVVCGTVAPEPPSTSAVCTPKIDQTGAGATFYQGANVGQRTDYTMDGDFGQIGVTGIPFGVTVTRGTSELFVTKAASLNTTTGYPSPRTAGVTVAISRNVARSTVNPYRGWSNYQTPSLAAGTDYWFWDSENSMQRTYMITDTGASRNFTAGPLTGVRTAWSIKAVWNKGDAFAQPTSATGTPVYQNGCGIFNILAMGTFGLKAANVLRDTAFVGASVMVVVTATLSDGTQLSIERPVRPVIN